MQDWVNFNIKSLGDITSQDSDSGFEQSTGKSTADYHSLYIEPWTDCHNNDPRRSKDRKNCGNQGDKVRIFVAGPSPKLERKKSYKSSGPNDERYYGELEILQIIGSTDIAERRNQTRNQRNSSKSKIVVGSAISV